MTICISNEIQFLYPVATGTTCGITLWAFSNNHLFGTAYKDILVAMDKIRQWKIDPTKHFRSEVHNFMIVIERANETNDYSMQDKDILAVFYEDKMPHKKFTPNNNINRLIGPPRGNSLDGQAPSYSTMQIRTLKLLANVNTVNESD